MVIMNDLEWAMLSYYVIYLKMSENNHAVNREVALTVQKITFYYKQYLN